MLDRMDAHQWYGKDTARSGTAALDSRMEAKGSAKLYLEDILTSTRTASRAMFFVQEPRQKSDGSP